MDIFDELGSREGMPRKAIRAATANRASVAPLLIEALERHDPRTEVEENALFIAFHLLGQWREKSAYRTLARFLRWPEVEAILNDATTATCHRVMANVFDGDPAPIYEIIHDADADEFVRGRLFDTLIILVFQNELDRTEVARFLRSAFDELRPREQCTVWSGWQGAIAILGLAELKPLVKEAFERGFIDEADLRLEEFEIDLQRSLAGDPVEEWRRKEFEPFGDVIKELSNWAILPNNSQEQTSDDWQPPLQSPVHNPFRDVGRNDPCPCGSGKKFKKCCLGKQTLDLEAAPSPDLPLFDSPDDDAGATIDRYDPLVAPDPQAWLATGEQERLDLIVRYHRRHGFAKDRLMAHASFHAIVENQVAMDDQMPVRRTLARLMAEGLDRHDAIHAIGSVLAGHVNRMMRDKSGWNEAGYFSELEQLTATGWLNSG